MYEDSIDLIAKLPAIAATIYRCATAQFHLLLPCHLPFVNRVSRSSGGEPPLFKSNSVACIVHTIAAPIIAAWCCRNTYKGGDLIAADPKLDWAANLSHMMGEAPLQQPWCLQQQ